MRSYPTGRDAPSPTMDLAGARHRLDDGPLRGCTSLLRSTGASSAVTAPSAKTNLRDRRCEVATETLWILCDPTPCRFLASF